MNHRRTRAWALVAAGLLVHGLAPRRGVADPPAPSAPVPRPAPAADPSPLTGAPATDPALDRAVHDYDRAQQAAADQAFAAHAAGAGRSDEEPPLETAPAGGRTGFQAHFQLAGALDQLDTIRMRTTGVRLEPRLEIAHTLAAEAWERFTVDQSNQVVVREPAVEPDYFHGKFTPTSIDDLPPVLAVRVPKSHTVVPPPPVPAPAAPSASWIPRDFVPKGVLVGFPEAAILEAMAAGRGPTAAQADAAEAALLAAGDEAAAARAWRALEGSTPAPSHDATVVSVSLRRAVEDAARDGSSGPSSFGGLARVTGVLLGTDGDVRVLGRRVEGAPPLVLDDVVTALATVWRDGLTPGCSLDPEPRDPAGPQHVRVIGVPRASAFAKTMLEADYEMKKVLLGVEDLHLDGVRTVPDLLVERPEGEGERMNRFWLCPVPPRPGDLSVSPDRRSILLGSAVEVRTERMLLGACGEGGTGRTSPSAEAAAAAFSEHYDEIARVRPVFRRLEGLFDLVLLARALRIAAPDHPLLARAAALPPATVEVPASYPGVSTSRAHALGVLTVSGGCDVGVRFERRALYELSEEEARALDAAAAASGPTTVRLPGAPRAPDASDRADDLVEATMALARGDAAEALAQADALIDRDPGHARARALRAEAFRALGRPEAALRDAKAAAALEPDDTTYRALVRRLRMDAEGAAALEGAPADVRAEIVRTEVVAAASALVRQDGRAAASAAARALLADPGSYEASMIAGSASWLEGSLDDAEAHVSRALSARPDDPDPRVLRALVRVARGRLEEARADLDAAIAERPEGDALGLRGLVRMAAGDVAGAADDAERGLALAPRSDLASAAASVVEMSGSAPVDVVERYVRDLFSLPVKAMLALGSALAAAEQGNVGETALGYERALAVLDEAGRPPGVVRTRMEVALLGLLPAAASALGRSADETLPRVDALTAALEARGDAPVSTQFARSLAENGLGARDRAMARLEAAIGALDRPDACLSDLFPGSRAQVEAQLRTIELAYVISDPQELLGGRRPAEMLSRLSVLLAGGPGEAAARGLSEAIEGFRKAPSEEEIPADVRSALRRRTEEVSSGFARGGGTLADAVLSTVFLSVVAQVEAKMGDLDDAVATARALWAVPVRAEASPYARVLIPTLREQAAAALVERWTREIDRDPAFAMPRRPDRAATERLAAAVEGRRKAAEALGEPSFLLLLDARLSATLSDVATKALEGRIERIERVLEVAAPGPKRERLVSDLAAARKALSEARDGRADAIRARIARAYGMARTMTQLRTLDRAVAAVAATAGADAPFWVAPPDAGLEALKRALAEARERARSAK